MAWCPELDVFTQGDHLDHAVAMLEEAVRLIVEDSINNIESDGRGDVRPKRVVHPLRLGRRASKDESWPDFQKMLELQKQQPWAWFHLKELSDGLDEHILVEGSFEIESRSGVNKVSVWFHEHAFVPGKQFAIEYMEAYSRRSRFCVRDSVLEKRPELVNELAQEHVARKKENIVGDVKVVVNTDP
jgi:hypothetical protein